MNKNLILILALIGVISLFSNCEKDGEQITIKSNVTAPSITTLPDLTLLRANGTDSIEFVGTPVDPGFTASAKYYLEACAKGNGFENVTTIYSGVTVESIKMTISDLNLILLKGFPQDQASSVDYRIRAVLEKDAGTGIEDMEYISAIKNESTTIYGLPRLDLLNSGIDQKIEAPLGDGKYNSYVKLDATQPFTLKDPDTGKIYGGVGGALAENGSGISIADNGYYNLEVDINALTYTTEAYMIGVIGDATPNGWDDPDQKLDYDIATGTWSITLDLTAGVIKFRKNDGWGWNMGFVEGEEPGMSGDLQQGGYGNDIPIAASGNYTIIIKIERNKENHP